MAPETINWTFNGLSMTDDADTRHWQTHNTEAYKRPQTQGAGRHKHQHPNMSQFDLSYGSAAPPDAHYRTMNSSQFGLIANHPVQRRPNNAQVGSAQPIKRRSEQYAASFERTRVPIGSINGAAGNQFMKDSMYETTNIANHMSGADLGRADKSQKRWVRETTGARRVASSVWLDRNIDWDVAAPFEQQSATHRGHEWPHTIQPQRQRHELPQKNYSTFLKPSGGIADGVTGTFATVTSHETVNPGVLARTKPAGGDLHYRTANMIQYGDIPRSAYVKSGSTAAAVRAKQEAFEPVDLGMGHSAPWMSQTKEAFKAVSLREEDRAVQVPRAMQGSLGAKQLESR